MAKNNTASKKKTECPMTLEQFQNEAIPIVVTIDGKPIVANVKAPFSSGSFGWYASDKVVITVDGVPMKVQVGVNLIVVGSKPEA